MSAHRSKFIIREESGHPGYRSTTIMATREDLEGLADEIKKKLAEGYQPPFVSHYATEAHGQSSRVYLQFEPASAEEIDRYHEPKNRAWDWFIRPTLGLLVAVLTVIGTLRVWQWIVAS